MHAQLLQSCLTFCSVRVRATLWTVAHQAPLSMGFSRQEYQEWVAIPFSRESSDTGIERMSPASPVLLEDSLTTEPVGKPRTKVSSPIP